MTKSSVVINKGGSPSVNYELRSVGGHQRKKVLDKTVNFFTHILSLSDEEWEYYKNKRNKRSQW